jgi:hydroxymethylpyrimidine pyrophosphatase-like HAD family hydrolase
MPSPYRLIALDLDGTLLDSSGQLSRENIKSIERARDAGIRVVICTGRGYKECQRYLDQLGQTDPVVVAGGAIIADGRTGQTLHRFTLREQLVGKAVARLLDHGLPALVLKDPCEVGFDYLVVHGENKLKLDPVTEWWFTEMNVQARYVSHISADEHPDHTVRFGVCGMSRQCQTIQDDLQAIFANDTHIHHFPAVVAPDHASMTEDGQKLHVLEVFSKQGNKGSALHWVASGMDVKLSECAAMGDQINDLTMLSAVGLGVAMGNAVPRVKEVARVETHSNDAHGVARAIDRILANEW